MEPASLFKIGRWLDVTDQQFKILLSIYKLESSKQETSPKNIEKEFLRSYGSAPQKSNLFSQMRALLKMGFLSREGQGRYSVDFDAMYSVLQEKRDSFSEELREFDSVSTQVKDYFKKAALQTIKPKVGYLEYDDFFRSLSRSMRVSDSFYSTANFPTIAYTYSLSAGIGRTAYTDSAWDLCFKRGELSCNYLTSLNIDFPFNHAFRVFGDPKRAYRECAIVIDQLGSLIEAHDNLDIRYLKESHGMDVFIPERYEPREFFMFIRDEHKNVIGGIEIRSPETAISAKQMFMRDFEYAERLKGRKGEEIIENLRAELEERYSICKV